MFQHPSTTCGAEKQNCWNHEVSVPLHVITGATYKHLSVETCYTTAFRLLQCRQPKRYLQTTFCSCATEHISWALAHSCPKSATVTRFRRGRSMFHNQVQAYGSQAAAACPCKRVWVETCFSAQQRNAHLVQLSVSLFPVSPRV